MATKKSQRIGILVIAAVLVAGTLGSFLVMVLSTMSNQQSAADQKQALADYKKAQAEYQKRIDARNIALSKQYYPIFSQFADQPVKFSIDSITKLSTHDLKVGDGKKITKDTKFAAYYIGWNPDGKVFDQSIEDGALKGPFDIDGLANTGVIEGWKEGLVGMKIGGVRLLEISSDKAYGEKGSGDLIPPNSPLKFVVMAISAPEAIEQPEIPLEVLQQLYGQGQ